MHIQYLLYIGRSYITILFKNENIILLKLHISLLHI